MRLLVVDDEPALQEIISRRLIQEGYSVDCASDGESALLHIEMGNYDCIVLDIFLPIKDGLMVLRQIRGEGYTIPVLLLTARDSVADRVAGLDAGADDYLVKPFSSDELCARIRALFRRRADNKSTVLEIDDLKMDTIARKVTRANMLIELTAKEYALLEYFLRNQERVLTRSQITEHIWNFDFDSDTNIVDVYVRYLRRKIDSQQSKLIHTVRGMGYIMSIER